MIKAFPPTTRALLVGIEKYNGFGDLNGPANDVYQFCQWLRNNNVPANNISVFLSPLESNQEIADKINNLTNKEISEATENIVNQALIENSKNYESSLFIVFWTGHGLVTPQGDRRLIYTDATQENLKNLNLTVQLNAMRTDTYTNLPQQLFIIDACANSPQFNFIPPDNTPQVSYDRTFGQKQMVIFAANPGEYAINKGAEQTGIFVRELMKELNLLPKSNLWFPEMEKIMKNIQQKFIELREKGETKQTPCYWMYQDWSGNINEQNLVEEQEIKSKTSILTKVEKIEELRKALLKCSSIRNTSQRKQIIRNLKPEIADSFEPGGNANIEVYNLIETCLNYEKGLLNLLQTMEILHERGTIQMKNLWQKVKQLFPEEVA